jgi:hypothetical protein
MRKSNQGLFDRSPPDGCTAEYRILCESKPNSRAAAVREGCEDLWRGFSDLADANFVERFPFEFHQRWFEMYLGAALRRAKLDVTAPKPGPDLRVMVEGRPIYIEAPVARRCRPRACVSGRRG